MNKNFDLNREIPIPLYYQIQGTLKKKIKKEFRSGDKFYSERQLTEMLSISRITASRVLNELVQEKLLYRLQGKGTFVADLKNMEKTFNIGFMVSRRLELLNRIHGHENNFQKLLYIQDMCGRHGYNVLCLSENTGTAGQENIVKAIEKIDGIIFLGDVNPNLIKFFNDKIPSVIMDDCPDAEIFDCVLGDNVHGADENVSYLIKNGHRRIGLIHGPLSVASFRERLEGYKKALQDNGIEYSDELIVEGGGLIEDGYKAMEKLLALKNPPTAVFGSNDIMAIGAMKKIKEAGLKIPEDISVTGFDDIDLASHVEPPLTTTSFNEKTLAEKSVSLLISKIDHRSPKPQIVRVPLELIIRKSCGKIN